MPYKRSPVRPLPSTLADELEDDVYGQLAKLAPTALFASPTRGDWESALVSVADVTGATPALTTGQQEFEALVALGRGRRG